MLNMNYNMTCYPHSIQFIFSIHHLMDWLNQINVDKFIVFTLVLTRVSGLTMTAPIYGSKDVPARVRVLLALALAVLIMPSQWNVVVPYPGTTLNYLVIIGGELVVGTCLGLGIMFLFNGMELAGEIIGYVGGLMMAEAYDPSYGHKHAHPLQALILG